MATSTLSPSAGTLAALLLVASAAFAQTPSQTAAEAEPSAHHDAADATAQPSSDLEAIEAELDLLVTRMEESKAESKLDAIEKLLATLVRQRRAMCGAMRAEGAASSATCCQHMHQPTVAGSDSTTEPQVESPSPSP